MVVLVAYSAWVYPFEVAFMNASPKGGLEVADIVVDLFFAVDIVLTFFVAYIDPRTQLLVRDRKKIALRSGTSTLRWPLRTPRLALASRIAASQQLAFLDRAHANGQKFYKPSTIRRLARTLSRIMHLRSLPSALPRMLVFSSPIRPSLSFLLGARSHRPVRKWQGWLVLGVVGD
jgi:hypothetical protein